MNVIAVDNITKRFGDVCAVDDVSLEVAEGEFLVLLGPSGCGKTTLLRIIAGLEQADIGTIRIGGDDMTATPAHKRPVNMMFQSYALFPHMTVADNIAFGLRQDGVKGEARDKRIAEALALVEMTDLAERKPAALSGGQQQRVALARCLAKQPKALLLDEPLAALDKGLRERTQLELMALRRRLGLAFVFVTHDQDEAMTMATRVAVMDKGRILQVATPHELYTRPASRAVAAFFGDMNIWDGIVSVQGLECESLGTSIPVRAAFPLGTTVAIAIRPEQVRLGGEGNVRLSATVEDVIYRGATSTVLARTADNAIVRATVTGAPPRVDEMVTLSWPLEAMLVLP